MSVNLDLNEALNSAIKIYNDKKITIQQAGYAAWMIKIQKKYNI